jgi:hypothetical protein
MVGLLWVNELKKKATKVKDLQQALNRKTS